MEAKQKVFFQINELLCFCLDSSPLPHPISLSLSHFLAHSLLRGMGNGNLLPHISHESFVPL